MYCTSQTFLPWQVLCWHVLNAVPLFVPHFSMQYWTYSSSFVWTVPWCRPDSFCPLQYPNSSPALLSTGDVLWCLSLFLWSSKAVFSCILYVEDQSNMAVLLSCFCPALFKECAHQSPSKAFFPDIKSVSASGHSRFTCQSLVCWTPLSL